MITIKGKVWNWVGRKGVGEEFTLREVYEAMPKDINYNTVANNVKKLYQEKYIRIHRKSGGVRYYVKTKKLIPVYADRLKEKLENHKETGGVQKVLREKMIELEAQQKRYERGIKRCKAQIASMEDTIKVLNTA